jgi:hypothetical protein
MRVIRPQSETNKVSVSDKYHEYTETRVAFRIRDYTHPRASGGLVNASDIRGGSDASLSDGPCMNCRLTVPEYAVFVGMVVSALLEATTCIAWAAERLKARMRVPE